MSGTAAALAGICSRLARAPRIRTGLFATGCVMLIAAIGPLVAPHSPFDVVGIPFDSPSGLALLGTDYLGHDTLSRVLCGGSSVVWMSLTATVAAVAAGTLIGVFVAYLGGFLGWVVDWINDVLLAFPLIVLAALLVGMLGRSPLLIVAVVALGWLPTVIRLSRSIAAATIQQEYVAAAQLLGTPHHRILLGEVLPNITTPLIVQTGALLTWSIGVIAGLNFLGFGIAPPTADWGLMVNENRGGLLIAPWATIAPVALIGAFALATNTLADGINEYLGAGRPSGAHP